MTEDEKYEIATLVSELERLRLIAEAHAIINTPSDPVARERVMISYLIAQIEYTEALMALYRAQLRIVRGP